MSPPTFSASSYAISSRARPAPFLVLGLSFDLYLSLRLYYECSMGSRDGCPCRRDLYYARCGIPNSQWTTNNVVSPGVLKHISDVGTAFWTLVIAAHTFCLLVLEIKMRQFILWTSLFAGWSFIGAIVIGGPATLDTAKRGPFREYSCQVWMFHTDAHSRWHIGLLVGSLA